MQHETGYLIHKSGRGWYRPNAKGYTSCVDEAGRYTHADAMSYSHPNGWDGPRDGITVKHESEVQMDDAALQRGVFGPVHDALDRMRRAHARGTGCHLTRDMIKALHLTSIGQMWEDTDPRKAENPN